MRCRRHDDRYTLFIQSRSSRPFAEDWRRGNLHVFMARTHWYPTADVYETEDKIYITAELAGINPEELEISLYNDALVIEGKRHLQPVSKEGIYHMAEIRQGSFCLELPLTREVNPDQIETHYENGLLSVVIHKQGNV